MCVGHDCIIQVSNKNPRISVIFYKNLCFSINFKFHQYDRENCVSV